jgi:glutamate formiminotransferase
MLTCALNVSEGRDAARIAALVEAAGEDLLDVHTDADHHRSVLTVVGEDAPRAVAVAALERIDLRRHAGAHPRLGVVDVVPFVAPPGDSLAEACAARDRFASWLGTEVGVPAFTYGPGLPTLPEIRRSAFAGLAPAAGPPRPHPRAGATVVGARFALVAYNLWLVDPDLATARSIARSLRGPSVRALGLAVGHTVQVSCNLIEPLAVGPEVVYDAVAARARISRAELVGLMPSAVLAVVDPARWSDLDLSPGRTVEARLAERVQGLRPSGTWKGGAGMSG